MRRVCLIAADIAAPPLQALIDAAEEGAQAAGGSLVVWDGGAPDADAYLVAAPIVLFGLPGALKTRLETWLDLLARGTLIAHTGGRAAGYLATYAPDDGAILEKRHPGLVFRGIDNQFFIHVNAPYLSL